MDRFSVYVPRLLPEAEPFVSTLRSCPGCGQALAVRIIGKALANHGRYPYGCEAPDVSASALPSEGWQTFPPRKASFAASKIDPAKVLAVAGESGAFEDLFSLLKDAQGSKKRLFITCFFNEAGIERHGSKPESAYAHDCIRSFSERLEGIHAILDRAGSAQPDFFATACASYPFDLIGKVHKALSCRISFLAVFVPCPTGCLYDPSLGLHAGRRAVQTGFFPLYQRESGTTSITLEPGTLLPLSAYLTMQQAYMVSPEETARVQSLVTGALAALRKKCP